MATAEPARQPRNTRRRGAALTAAIHEAVAAELAENGYDGVTFDRIAKRASMSKATLYGRYDRPAQLITEMLGARAQKLTFESAGSLRSDLLAIIDSAIEQIERVGPDLYRRLVGSGEESFAVLAREAGSSRASGAIDKAVKAAVERGEIGPGSILSTALEAPIQVLHSQILLTDDWRDAAEDIVDSIALPLFRTLAGSPR